MLFGGKKSVAVIIGICTTKLFADNVAYIKEYHLLCITKCF